MDQQKLRTLVFEKTGVRIDIDDPIFALVALNEAVLAEAVGRHVGLMEGATARLAEQLARLQERGQAAPAEPYQGVPVKASQERRMLALAGGAAVVGAALVLIGQALLFRPPSQASNPVKELSSEQALALRNGEKLTRIVGKLDEKTRSAIAAEMQKP